MDATPKTKKRAARDGVSMKHLGGGAYRYRWLDPVTRVSKAKMKRDLTAAQAQEYRDYLLAKRNAVRKHERRKLAMAEVLRADEVVDAIVKGKPVPELELASKRYTIERAAEDYYETLAVDVANPSVETLKNAERHTFFFLAWCRLHGLRHLDELTLTRLLHCTKWLKRRTKPKRFARGGSERYKVTEVNQILKTVRAMLTQQLNAKRMHPDLTLADLRAGLKHTPANTKTDRNKHGVKNSQPLDVDDIRTLLRAALLYDATRKRARNDHVRIAPDVALLLLLGLRLKELTFTRMKRVSPDALEHSEVFVGADVAKRGEDRHVYQRNFTTVGTELLLLLKARHGDNEWLSAYEYDSLRRALRSMRSARYGAPRCSPHDLRATCATYQTALKDMDTDRRVARLGHSEAESWRTYSRAPKGMLYGQESLEAAMLCTAEFQAVLQALREAPVAVRSARRAPPCRPRTDALLHSRKDPRALRNALDAFVKRQELAPMAAE